MITPLSRMDESAKIAVGKSKFAALLAFSIVVVGAISNSRATVTYDFVNTAYPQNGYTIYGKIVTDGHTGYLNSNDTQSTLDPSSPYAATSLSISDAGFVTPLPAYFLGFNGLEVVGNKMYLDLGGMAIATSGSSAAFELTFNNAGPGNPSTYAQGFINLAVKWSDGSLTGPLLIAVAALPGDVNGDGIVNGQDIAVVASHWLQTGTGANDPPGDANFDGIINAQDIAVVASNWLQTTAGNGGSGGGTAVPEPSTLVLSAVAGLAFLACRHRRVWPSFCPARKLPRACHHNVAIKAAVVRETVNAPWIPR